MKTPTPKTLELAFDPQDATEALRRADKRLGRLIERAGPFTLRPQGMQSPFEALLRAIVYQQLSGKAAATILRRVQELFGGRTIRPQALLDVPIERLRGAGLSRAKAAAVRDLATKTLDGTVPTLARLKGMDDAEITSRLVSVRGIGPWTVEMLLMFRLGRADVMPATDLGVRRGFMITYAHSEMPTPAILIQWAQRWRPYRSVASWYMWRAVDLDKAGAGGSAQPLIDEVAAKPTERLKRPRAARPAAKRRR